MRGILIYNQFDLKKNQTFINWIIESFHKKNVILDFFLREEFYRERNIIYKYDFAINRTRDFNLSQLLELNNIRVFNNSEITLLGNNKLATYLFAKNKGYLIPDIPLILPSSKQMVSKPIYGHGGEGVKLLFPQTPLSNRTIYQQYIDNLKGDVRFYFIGNKIHSSVIRFSKDKFVFNYSQGADFSEYIYSKFEEKYVMNLVSNLLIDYVGVDFFLLKDGTMVFNEIEDVVGSRMLSKLGKNDTIPMFVEHIINSIC